MHSVKQPSGLIEVLLDRSASLAERDDAAMDLHAFDDPEALSALLQVAADPDEPEVLVASCGESIGSIWLRQGAFDPASLARLAPAAQREINSLQG